MNVAVVYSPDWAHYAAVETFSIFKTNSVPVKVYHISDGVNQLDLSEMCAYFGDGYTVEYIDADPIFREKIPSAINVDTRFTKYALYRLLLPILIQDERVLYIDADAVVNGDLTKFYNMDLGRDIVAGVTDSGADYYNLKTPIGLTDSDTYINAGVTLLDLKKIREERLTEIWIDEVNNRHYACHDQCIINKTCRGRIRLVDGKYNVSPSTSLETGDIKIMHYAGNKPWKTADVRHHHIWRYWAEEYQRMFGHQSQRIPKVIHYCWFGGRPKPPIVQMCMESWKRHLPDYEIKEWNESNFDVHANPYTAAAYNSGMYAFVTDYVRMQALLQYGGIYMDSDVEILKPLDGFLHHGAFTGHETAELMVTAIMGAVPGHEWIRTLLDYYRDRAFERVPNTQVITQLSQPLVQKHENGFRHLAGDVVIYPVETFCPFDHANLRPTPTENSYAVHHFAGTWLGRTAV